MRNNGKQPAEVISEMTLLEYPRFTTDRFRDGRRTPVKAGHAPYGFGGHLDKTSPSLDLTGLGGGRLTRTHESSACRIAQSIRMPVFRMVHTGATTSRMVR
jgi:hypothetical protein